MKGTCRMMAAVTLLASIAVSSQGQAYPTIASIVKDGKAAVGRTVTIRLKPKSIIVANGVFSMVDGEGASITVAVPREMTGRVERMRKTSFYTCTIQLQEVGPGAVRGLMRGFAD